MKILHVIPTFYPATYWGGPIYSGYGLCNALARNPGVELRVFTTDSAGPKYDQKLHVQSIPQLSSAGYDIYYCQRLFGLGMFPRLWPMIQWADVIHLTAVYSPPTIPTLLFCRLLGKPVVWSPRGALQRWEGATKPLAKRVWEWICNALIKPGKCVLHVTSEQEAAASEARVPKAIAELIPNGVDIPQVLPNRDWLPDGRLRLLYLGRLHSIKGIENLLRALKVLEDESVSLAICGRGDEAYSSSLRLLVRELGLERCVNFQGYVDGEEKMKVFMGADVCVVPSFTESFGMVVAEALAHGVPVIASQGTPWDDLEKRGCGLWVDNTPEGLANAIREIHYSDLERMGGLGREWMLADYNWNSIATRMHNTYRELINGK